jgi:NADPH-dependent curcumin reductase CurA
MGHDQGATVPDFIPPYTSPLTNRRIVLARRPAGIPLATDFQIDEAVLDKPADGQFLVRNLYLSADPVQRGWAANPALTPIGAPMRALAVGIVVESLDADINPGEIVYGFFGWQDYALATKADLLSHIAVPRARVSLYAGVLGMPGVTAWLALNDLAPPAADQPILVSTAAGAVGSVVGQIARQAGAYVVGLTGSDEKVALCTSRFGYDAAFNYKTADLAKTLADARPDGFKTYFDNTGGDILDTAIRAMAKYGRIIQCGTAATASWNPPPRGLRNEREILTRVLTWSGFYIFDHVARFGAAIDSLTDLLLAGGLDHDEDIDNGLATAAGALEVIFAGTNAGKKLIFIGDS